MDFKVICSKCVFTLQCNAEKCVAYDILNQLTVVQDRHLQDLLRVLILNTLKRLEKST